MMALLRALSLSYVRRHRVQTFLTVAGVAIGVATYSSIRAAQTTLVSGLVIGVDRVAGKAHLQITGVGGVDELLLETLRNIPGVEAQAPIIEQVVTLHAARPASMLVLGIDLLGDRRMREYGFEGEDADVDDPLLFLAQPDSIAVSAVLAARLGIQRGDTVDIQAGAMRRRVIVRGLLRTAGFAEAFGGDVAITDVYAAQELFGRGRRFDRIDLRLAPHVSINAGTELVQRAAGNGYVVETPARRGAQMERLITAFVGSFDVSSGLAVVVGTFLVFNVLTVSVDRRRRPIGIARAIGATPGQIQRIFLCEAMVLGIVGGLLGLALGQGLAHVFLGIMGNAVATTYGLEQGTRISMTPTAIVQALGLGVVAAFIGAWMPARSASRVPPVNALAAGVFRARTSSLLRPRLLAGLLLAALPAAVAWLTTASGPFLVLATAVSGTSITLLVAGPLGRGLVAAAGPLIRRMAPVSGQVAADALASQPRRTAVTTAAVTMSLALVLGAGGFLHSTRAAFGEWVSGVVTSDLVVRASLDLAPSGQDLPIAIRDEIARLPDVRAVATYRMDWVRFHDEDAGLVSIDSAAMLPQTRELFVQGDKLALTEGLVSGKAAAVSENFARRFGVWRGDILELASPGGPVRLPVAAVVSNFISDRGVVIVDRAVFLRHWGVAGVDALYVTLKPGTDPVSTRAALSAALSAGTPVIVSTQREFLAQIDRALDGYYTLMRMTIALLLTVAFVGIATSMLISVVERSREIGILKALGASHAQVRAAVVLEAMLITGTGGVVALPLGSLLARFLETVVAERYAGFVLPHAYPMVLMAQMVIGAPVLAALAAWVPAQHAVGTRVVDAISYE